MRNVSIYSFTEYEFPSHGAAIAIVDKKYAYGEAVEDITKVGVFLWHIKNDMSLSEALNIGLPYLFYGDDAYDDFGRPNGITPTISNCEISKDVEWFYYDEFYRCD